MSSQMRKWRAFLNYNVILKEMALPGSVFQLIFKNIARTLLYDIGYCKWQVKSGVAMRKFL